MIAESVNGEGGGFTVSTFYIYIHEKQNKNHEKHGSHIVPCAVLGKQESNLRWGTVVPQH